MIDTKDSDPGAPQRAHDLKAGDTPAHGLPYTPGSGGKRRAAAGDSAAEQGAAFVVGDDVLWQDRLAVVAEIFPAGEWAKDLGQLQFDDDGSTIVVGRDELQLVETTDGARYFTSRTNPDLGDTAPLPSPVARRSVEVPASLLEEQPAEPTEQLPRVGDTREWFEWSAPEHTLPAVPVVAAQPRRRVGALASAWRSLLEVLRIIAAFFAWPFTRDGGRALAGWLVDQVAEGVEAAADWERWHSRLIAKVVIGVLSGLILAGLGAAWLIRTGVFA